MQSMCVIINYTIINIALFYYYLLLLLGIDKALMSSLNQTGEQTLASQAVWKGMKRIQVKPREREETETDRRIISVISCRLPTQTYSL